MIFIYLHGLPKSNTNPPSGISVIGISVFQFI